MKSQAAARTEPSRSKPQLVTLPRSEQETTRLPTLRALLNLPAFRGARLVCCTDQVDQPVTWVHIGEVLEVWRFLTGGELVLSTGLELFRATPSARSSFIRCLAQAGARGLALETVQWFTELPGDLIDVARDAGLPLIVFEREVSFQELTRAAHKEILMPPRPRERESTLQTIVNALVDTRRDREFIRTELGAVLALPPRPRTALLSTLEVLLDAQFNITAASRMLGIRRQTVYYRLDQLIGLLGSLDEPSRRLGFLVAFALLRRRMSAESSGQTTPSPNERS